MSSNFVFYKSSNNSSISPPSNSTYVNCGDSSSLSLLSHDYLNSPQCINNASYENYRNYSPSPLVQNSSITNCEKLNSSETIYLSEYEVSGARVKLRFLTGADCEAVKELCEDWFPVKYPSSWFRAITSDLEFYSLAATCNEEIIGLIVAELRQSRFLKSEESDILAKSQLKDSSVAYILSLGVVHSFRRNGIASLLLSNLLQQLSTIPCKAVYLHVLTSNEPAIRFYEKHQFRVHKFLPYYYHIGGRGMDGFKYVLYINSGHRPWGFNDYAHYFIRLAATQLCSLPHWMLGKARRVTHSIMSLIR